MPRERKIEERKENRRRIFPLIVGIFLIFVGALFLYIGSVLYGTGSALGLADIGTGLGVLALAVGVIYHALSENTLADKIEELSGKIDMLLLNPDSPLLSKIDDNNRELHELKEAIQRLEKRMVGQDGRSLASGINAKLAQIKKLLEL